MSNFSGKTALVTGAGSGIGEATAKRLAAGGAKVVVSDINGEAAGKVAAAIREAGGQAIANIANTARHEEVKAAVEFAVQHYGGLHLAFNNAGIGGSTKPLAELEIADWQRVIDINLSGVFYGMKYEIPAILASGGGAIVNTASILGLVGTAGLSAYVAAKHGVAGLTKTAAIEYSAKGVRINSLHPGYIDTPLLDFLDRDTYNALQRLHPIGRLGTPEEVAAVAAFLLSDDAAFVTGSQSLVDGAYTSA